MKEDKRSETLIRAGRIFLQDLATTDQSTTDETLEAIDRYFDRPYYNLTDEELARFPEAVAAAGLDLLAEAGLPTDLGDLADLEDIFRADRADQPHEPRPHQFGSSAEYKNALTDWEAAHAAYWKNLETAPEFRLFADEKLIAAFRLQAAAGNLIGALMEKRPAIILAESTKLAMLAIRAGVFDMVEAGKSFTRRQRNNGFMRWAEDQRKHNEWRSWQEKEKAENPSFTKITSKQGQARILKNKYEIPDAVATIAKQLLPVPAERKKHKK